MKLRPIEQQILEASGNPKDLVRKFYGLDISENNSNKRMTGVRMHLNFIKDLDETVIEDIENELVSLETVGMYRNQIDLLRL